jgi:hypothetical protein
LVRGVSAPVSPNLAPAVIVLVLIVLIIVRRTYGQIQGTPYSTGRLFGFGGFTALLFVLLAFGTIYAAVAFWGSVAYGLVAAYVAVPALAAAVAAPYVQRVVRFEPREDGSWYYRLSWHIPVLYLTLFVVRIVAEVAIFGLSAVLAYPPPTPPSAATLAVLIGVDLLFGVSFGLLVGRGIGVYRAHRALPSSAPASSPSPPLAGA